MDKIKFHKCPFCRKSADEICKLLGAQIANLMIPCNEKLPEIGVPVLTYDGQFYSVERRIEYIDTDDGPLYGDWWIDGYNGDESYPYALRDGAPTHWMPLTEKP